MYTTIELFAGAGGLALGVEKAGFDTIGLIEFDKDAADSLKKNRPNWNVINDDIANISCLDLEEYFSIEKGKLDLLSGGAPCQAFSYAGKRLAVRVILRVKSDGFTIRSYNPIVVSVILLKDAVIVVRLPVPWACFGTLLP